ncbi:MAG: PAS domain S-box protein [Bacteroidetes bacterium]|nr:PAS domain S-box protein [Bacteroidota bacterium]MBU1580676.1 PAS domain S-box protein [Bacteroidota bacterium]MBU2556293.1 PAS domain S-box protein [Bacteroidota bacterium]
MKENEIYWKQLLKALPEPLIICKRNGLIQFTNDAAVQGFGQVEGAYVSSIIPELENQEILTNWINQENERTFFSLLINAKRQIKWSCRLAEGHSQPDSLLMLFPKINKSCNCEEDTNGFTLFKSQFDLSPEDPNKLFRTLFADSPIGIAVIDSATKHFSDCNSALSQILGYSKTELQQLTYFDITPKRFHQLDRIQTEALYISGHFGPYEKAYYHKNGHTVAVVMHGLNFFRSDGERMVLIFVQDISRKAALEATLRDYENRLNILFEDSPDAYFIADMKGVLVDANRAAEQLLGDSKAKLLGKSLLQLNQLPLSEVPKVASILAHNAIGKQSVSHEIVIEKTRGNHLIIELSAYPVIIGNKSLILGTARDITDLKTYEDHLVNARNKAQKYLDIAGSLIIGFNRDSTVRLINQAGCQIAGKEKEEIIGKKWSSLLKPGREREKIQEFLNDAFENNFVTSEAIESRLITVSGFEYHFLWKNTLLYDEKGQVNGLLCSGIDITELKRVQKLLTDKEARTANLNRLSQLALQAEDKKPDWIKLSESLQQLMQCDVCYITTWDAESKQAIPLAAPEALYDYYKNYRAKPNQKSLTQSVLEKGKALVIQHAGESKYVSHDISKDFETVSGLGLPMIVGEEKIGAILVGFYKEHKFTADEVEWGELAANHLALALHKSRLINELKKSNADKDRFFSILSHDLRSPFAGVEKLSALLLENEAKLPANERKELLSTLHKTVKDLNVLIDNLLSWSRLNRGVIKPSTEQIALNELIVEVCSILEPQAFEKNIKFTKNIDSDIEFEADREMLKAVLRNLCSNAIKFSKPKSEIRIVGRKKSDAIELIVEDDGIGIDAAKLKVLKSTGSIASEPGTANEKGTGLGLLIVQDFVRMHQGTLEIASKLKKGSKFTVRLPN